MKVEEEKLEAVVEKTKKTKKDTSPKVSLEEKASEWMEMQETTPRPGSSYKKQYIPKGVSLNPIVKMVKPESLRPNPRNDFDPLTEEEYASLKENIALNGILDALTARKDGTIITGENRYKIALELKEHEDETVRRRVESIPVRYYMNELTPEEEYDILEGDNLFRRHLTSEQRKERLKKRILRKYKDDLILDNRGGDRKSESSKTVREEEPKQEGSSLSEKGLHEMSVSELGLFGEVGTVSEQAKQEGEVLKTESEKSNYEGHRLIEKPVELAREVSDQKSKVQGELLIEGETQKPRKEDFSLIGIGSEKSKYQGDILIGKPVDLAKKVSENENIPLGTARRYVTELKKELKSKAPKASSPKEKKVESGKKTRKQIVEGKAKEFQKKYSKLSRNQKAESVNRLLNSLVNLRKRVSKLNDQISELGDKDHEIVTKLIAVGERERIWKLKI
ncbi:chromosome partitioning protein ParB [Leptospira noguchii]|uniref:chromosome partitioning protein ParB n=1 Tax=Leptospira noguchii TaxID=28182 RepID=UPI001F068740|nr:chromosome partitioning protein ParB [Leptospira noguchii]MCH1911606.1 chromosome partitioning protein ParB [Leptospira noguchii]MCH1914683.1 chromosome partitioning protein ParB [Leptospira noguchii]MCH1914704.1 chromosome partitioning protein ParB [Leptospira noguchii]UOG64595.1 chromosome partitioning protein ParB [Leptospira noguchii]UOG64616.1 chromosome partitioning protein ParB [Leptospira noguchii]